MLTDEVHILLIEDNAGDVELLREALDDVAEANYSVVHAGSMAEGTAKLSTDAFDVVLLDLSLPDTRGLATVRMLRAENDTTPVVVLTGLSDERTGLLALQAGAQDFLVKGNAPGDIVWRALRYAIERKRNEEQIRSLNADLERRVDERTEALHLANEELEAFIYSASHDLRTPLRSIEGFVSILLAEEAARLGDESSDLLRRARRAVLQMDALLSALLKLSRLGNASIEPVRVDLAAVARRVVSSLRDGDADTTVVDIPYMLPAIADEELVEQLLQTLLTNAWKFTRDRPRPHITLAQSPDGGWTLRDNGVGFDMKYVDKLFRPFQRLHNPEAYPGSGLGLVIARRVVELHGGRIEVHSVPGEGTTFRFTLAPDGPESEAGPAS
jgi:signal transduction histidine kinase